MPEGKKPAFVPVQSNGDPAAFREPLIGDRFGVFGEAAHPSCKPFHSSNNSLNACFHAIGFPISSYLALCFLNYGLEIRSRGFKEWSILVFADEAMQLLPRRFFFTVACRK